MKRPIALTAAAPSPGTGLSPHSAASPRSAEAPSAARPRVVAHHAVPAKAAAAPVPPGVRPTAVVAPALRLYRHFMA